MPVASRKPGWQSGNLIFSAVPPEEAERLLPHLELIELAGRQEIHPSGAHLSHLYFPLDCVVAKLGISRQGSTVQYALIGREGFLGLNVLLGDTRAVGYAIVQSAGSCYRVAARPLMEAFRRSEALRWAVLRYASWRVLQTSQTSLCNAHHTVEQRLCCWLLQTLDRVAVRELSITQQLVASVLGVRREAVTIAALRLQAQHAIQCSRGHIAVLDPRQLEALCCECYAVLKDGVERLARDIGATNGSQAR